MKLIDYIAGSRRGREANRLEREAMRDPFLADAIAGYDSVYGDHSGRLAELSQMIEMRSRKLSGARSRKRRIAAFSAVAATILAGATVAILYIVRLPDPSGNTYMADKLPSVLREQSAEGEAFMIDDVALTLPRISGEKMLPVEDASGSQESVCENSAARQTFAASEDTHISGAVAASAPVSARNSAAGVLETMLITDSSGACIACCADEMEAVVMETSSITDTDLESEDYAEESFNAAGGTHLRQADTANAVAAEATSLSVPEGEVAVDENRKFTRYFNENRKGVAKGTVVVEFRVNDHLVPSDIRIISGISPEINREVIELMLAWPGWESTGSQRIRIILEYD